MTTRRLTKLEFVTLLGDAFIPILSAAKVNVDIEAFVKLIDWATPDADATSIDLDDPRVSGGLYALEAGGLLPAGKATEILSTTEEVIEPLRSATVFKVGSNFVTVPVGDYSLETYDASWEVSSLIAQLIVEGAQIRTADTGIEIFKKIP